MIPDEYRCGFCGGDAHDCLCFGFEDCPECQKPVEEADDIGAALP